METDKLIVEKLDADLTTFLEEEPVTEPVKDQVKSFAET